MPVSNVSVGFLLSEKEQEVARLREQALTSLEGKVCAWANHFFVAWDLCLTFHRSFSDCSYCSCKTESSSL